MVFLAILLTLVVESVTVILEPEYLESKIILALTELTGYPKA